MAASIANGHGGRSGPSNDDIELALAASEDTDGDAFALRSSVQPETAAASERQGLRSGIPNSSHPPAGLASEVNSRFSRQERYKQWKWIAGGSCGILLLLVILAALAAHGGGGAGLPNTTPKTYANFFVIGDWGRQGLHNQSDVAAVMASVAHDATTKPDFVISTGDNFYESGLSSVTDDLFRASFMDVYSAASLKGVPWHAVLGNHDYGESDLEKPTSCAANDTECFYSPIHQMDIRLRDRDARWHCERSFEMQLGDGNAELFFFDSSPFLESYYNASWVKAEHIGGLQEQSWRGNLKELEARLAASKAQWKLVIGHHPVYSSGGGHGDTVELQLLLEPVLRRYGVQAYFSGHDHHLEHLRVPNAAGPNFIVSGAGSSVRPVREGEAASQFKYYGSGFVGAVLKSEVLELNFYGILDDSHRPIHSVTIPRVAPKGRRRR